MQTRKETPTCGSIPTMQAKQLVSRPVVSTPSGVVSQETIIFTEKKETVDQGAVCEGILTLVNGNPFWQPSGTDVRAPELGKKATECMGRWNTQYDRDECTSCEQEYSNYFNCLVYLF
jgi:hypothetical protein